MKEAVIFILFISLVVFAALFVKVDKELKTCEIDKRIKEYHIARYCS